MKREDLQFYVDMLKNIATKQVKNRYEVHAIVQPYLYRMAQEGKPLLYEILKKEMLKPNFFLRKEHSPGFQINLIAHPSCDFNCSFFIPLANNETLHTYSPMHTHGEYLLSTINAFGKGYTSLIWQQGKKVNTENNEVEMKLQKYCQHHYMNVEFMDKDTAHTIFYPNELCITYAFWTHSKPTNFVNKLRGNTLINKNKEMFKKIITTFIKSPEKLGIVLQKEDYFYPKDGKLYSISSREIQPEVLTFPQNFFSVLQTVGFNDNLFIEKLSKKIPENAFSLVNPWIQKFLSGEKISINYEGYNAYHPTRNVHINEFKKIYNF
ncbi:MAG: hypothetical protein JSU07_01595 [Bacteroidetes bacterium]|nr:hypothetical protein [Bacteroidota bacterium]